MLDCFSAQLVHILKILRQKNPKSEEWTKGRMRKWRRGRMEVQAGRRGEFRFDLFSPKCHNCKKGFIKHQSQFAAPPGIVMGLQKWAPRLKCSGSRHCMVQVTALLRGREDKREVRRGQVGMSLWCCCFVLIRVSGCRERDWLTDCPRSEKIQKQLQCLIYNLNPYIDSMFNEGGADDTSHVRIFLSIMRTGSISLLCGCQFFVSRVLTAFRDNRNLKCVKSHQRWPLKWHAICGPTQEKTLAYLLERQ